MGDGYEISIKKLAKQKADKAVAKDPEITADEPHVISTDTDDGLKKYAAHMAVRHMMDKTGEYDEEAGDGDYYLKKKGWNR